MLDFSYLLELVLQLRRQAQCHSHTKMIPQRCGRAHPPAAAEKVVVTFDD
jgi:hypothetical protein